MWCISMQNVHLVKKVWIEYTWQKFGPSIPCKSLDRVYMAKVWIEYTMQKFGPSIHGKKFGPSIQRNKKKENFFGMAGPGRARHTRQLK